MNLLSKLFVKIGIRVGCITMQSNFNLFMEDVKSGNLQARNYADIALKVVSLRKNWKRTKKDTLISSEGNVLVINDDDSFASVVLSVILNDYMKWILSNRDPEQALNYVVSNILKYYPLTSEDIENNDLYKDIRGIIKI